MVRMTPAKLLAAPWKSPLARRSVSSVAAAAGALAAGGAVIEGGSWAEAATDSSRARSRPRTYFMGESYRGPHECHISTHIFARPGRADIHQPGVSTPGGTGHGPPTQTTNGRRPPRLGLK